MLRLRAHLPWRWNSGTALVHAVGSWVDALGVAQGEMPVSGCAPMRGAPMLTAMLTAMLSPCSPISRGDAEVLARGLSAASMSISSAEGRREAARARGGAARCGAVAGRALRAARLPGGPCSGTVCGGGNGRSPAPIAGLADCGREVCGRRGDGDGCLNGVGGSVGRSSSVGRGRRMLGDGARDEARESRGRGPPFWSQADADSPAAHAAPLPPPAWAGTGERSPGVSPLSTRTRVPSLPNIT